MKVYAQSELSVRHSELQSLFVTKKPARPALLLTSNRPIALLLTSKRPIALLLTSKRPIEGGVENRFEHSGCASRIAAMTGLQNRTSSSTASVGTNFRFPTWGIA
jgi:hypothetical protein